MCTRAIERIDHRLALDVGSERDPGTIAKTHWTALATRCDVRPRFLVELVEQMAATLLDDLPRAREDFEARFGPHPALQRVERVVIRQCRRALRA